MCGIAGFVESPSTASPFGPEVSQALVHRMCDVIRHRGPDDEGVWVNEGVALGMRRLSIIDLSTGHQPIQTKRTIAQSANLQLCELRRNCRPPAIVLHVDGYRGHRSRA